MAGEFLVVRPIDVTSDVLFATTAIAGEDEWDEYATYAEEAQVRRFKDGKEWVWQSLVAGNTGNDPALDEAGEFWTQVGATNPYAMFDGAIQSQTIAADELTVELHLPIEEIADTLYLANIAATELRVILEDPLAEASDQVVFDETIDLVSTVGITDWHPYFFTPPRRLSELTVEGLGSYAGARLTVTLSNYGDLAACGALLAGFGKPIGKTMYNPRLGMRDYSVKEEDAFGNLTVVERPYRKTAGFIVAVRNVDLDDTFETLVANRATPVLFLGSARYAAMAVYGFLKDFEIAVPGPRISYLNLNAESLT
jgi:hypothetical protein